MRILVGLIAGLMAYTVVRVVAVLWFGVNPDFAEAATVLFAVVAGNAAYDCVAAA